jgi:hypothetical protein
MCSRFLAGFSLAGDRPFSFQKKALIQDMCDSVAEVSLHMAASIAVATIHANVAIVPFGCRRRAFSLGSAGGKD